MTGVAATALIAVAVAVTGALTGSIGELRSFGRQPASASASARATAHSPGYPGAAGHRGGPGADPDPEPEADRPRPRAPTPRPTSGPGSLCREYFEYPEHPVPGGAAAWFALGRQLSKLAGGPFKVYGYCLRYLDNPLAGRDGWPMIAAGTGGPGRRTGRPGPGERQPGEREPGEPQPRDRRPGEPGQSGHRGRRSGRPDGRSRPVTDPGGAPVARP